MKKRLFWGIGSFAMLAMLNFTKTEHGFISYSNASTSSTTTTTTSTTVIPIQPNIKDCIYAYNIECWALHPTDPKKDVIRINAMWPEF